MTDNPFSTSAAAMALSMSLAAVATRASADAFGDLVTRRTRSHGRHNGTHGSTRIRRHRSLKAKAGAR